MTASNEPAESSPYQLYIYFGDEKAPEVSDASIVAIHPSTSSIDDVLSAVAAASLTAADLRTRTLFLAASTDVNRTIALYATLCGFAGRPLDFSDLKEVTDVRVLRTDLEAALAGDRPASPHEFVLVGHGIGPDLLGELSVDDVLLLRHAKEVVLLPTLDVSRTLEEFAVLAALRFRSGAERFPRLLPSGVALATDATDESVLDVALELDGFRREGSRIRRERRIDDRATLVGIEDPDGRRLRLITAAALPVTEALRRLGSVENQETGFWRCPRPSRHRNGDANPSAKVSEGKFRCFKCDLEYVDSLRLVMDAHDCTPDDAADWLLRR